MPVVVRRQVGTHRAMMVAIVVMVMAGTIIGTAAAKSSTGIAWAMVVMIATGPIVVGTIMIVAGTVVVMTRAVVVGAIIIVAGAVIIVAGAVAVMPGAVMVGTIVIVAGTIAVMSGAVMSVITGTRLRLMGARGRFAAVNAATAIGYRHRKSNTKRKYSGGFKESVHKLNFYN